MHGMVPLDWLSRKPSTQTNKPKTHGELLWSLTVRCFRRLSCGLSGGAKVSCILHNRGVQLILAYSCARPAILVTGKGRGGMFLFPYILCFNSYSSFFIVPLFHLLYYLFCLLSPFLLEMRQNDPKGVVKPQHNQLSPPWNHLTSKWHQNLTNQTSLPVNG